MKKIFQISLFLLCYDSFAQDTLSKYFGVYSGQLVIISGLDSSIKKQQSIEFTVVKTTAFFGQLDFNPTNDTDQNFRGVSVDSEDSIQSGNPRPSWGKFYLDLDSLFIKSVDKSFAGVNGDTYYYFLKRTSIETGINKGIENKLEVFPNPSRGHINLNIPDKSKLEGIKVFTTQGVEIITGFELRQDTLFIGALLPGSYFATVTTDKQNYTFNFMKE